MLTDSQMAEAEGALEEIDILQRRCRAAELWFLVYLFNIAQLYVIDEQHERYEAKSDASQEPSPAS